MVACHGATRLPAKRDSASAIPGRDLAAEERGALLAGDVAWNYERGRHGFLLAYLTRWSLFGFSPPVYSERIRKARDARDAEQLVKDRISPQPNSNWSKLAGPKFEYKMRFA